MTAPVVQRTSEQIAITAPVAPAGRGEAWKIQFVIPARYTLATMPQPAPGTRARYPVIRSRGSRSGGAVAARTGDERRGWAVRAEPLAWFYDPPWTLPPLRRNEVAVEVQ